MAIHESELKVGIHQERSMVTVASRVRGLNLKRPRLEQAPAPSTVHEAQLPQAQAKMETYRPGSSQQDQELLQRSPEAEAVAKSD